MKLPCSTSIGLFAFSRNLSSSLAPNGAAPLRTVLTDDKCSGVTSSCTVRKSTENTLKKDVDYLYFCKR